MAIPFWDPRPGLVYSQEYQPAEWDRLVVGGVVVPGIAEVSAKAGYKMDHVSAPGKRGGNSRNTGYQPSDVEIKVRIWTEKQWLDFQPIYNYLWPQKKTAPNTAPAPSKSDVANARATLLSATTLVGAGGVLDPATVEAVTQAQAVIAADNLAKAPTAARDPIAIYHPELALLGINALQIVGTATSTKGAAPQEKIWIIRGREYLPPTDVSVSTPKKSSIAATHLDNPNLQTQTANPTPANGTQPRPSANAAQP